MQRSRSADTLVIDRSRSERRHRSTASESRRSAPPTSRLPPPSWPGRTAVGRRPANKHNNCSCWTLVLEWCCWKSWLMQTAVNSPPVQHPQNLSLTGPLPWWWPWWTGWCYCTPPLCTACTPLLSSRPHEWFWHRSKFKNRLSESR